MQGGHLPSFRACLNSRRPMPERRYTRRHSASSSLLARRTGRSSQHSTDRPCRWKSPACNMSMESSALIMSHPLVMHAGLLIAKVPQLSSSLREVGAKLHCPAYSATLPALTGAGALYPAGMKREGFLPSAGGRRPGFLAQHSTAHSMPCIWPNPSDTGRVSTSANLKGVVMKRDGPYSNKRYSRRPVTLTDNEGP